MPLDAQERGDLDRALLSPGSRGGGAGGGRGGKRGGRGGGAPLEGGDEVDKHDFSPSGPPVG
jgi:hypothetical protein